VAVLLPGIVIPVDDDDDDDELSLVAHSRISHSQVMVSSLAMQRPDGPPHVRSSSPVELDELVELDRLVELDELVELSRTDELPLSHGYGKAKRGPHESKVQLTTQSYWPLNQSTQYIPMSHGLLIHTESVELLGAQVDPISMHMLSSGHHVQRPADVLLADVVLLLVVALRSLTVVSLRLFDVLLRLLVLLNARHPISS